MKSVLFALTFLCSFKSLESQEWFREYPDTVNQKHLSKVIITETVSYAAGLSFLSFIWYKDQERVPFHYYDDSKGYLQIDKAGHAYSAYRESYSAYFALRRAGLNKKKALIYGAPIGLLFQTPIEIFDGLYDNWGFSWYDMIANTFGSALLAGQEAIYDDQIITMKFSYSPSIYPNYHSKLGDNHLERFFLDYNAHSYWLSANLRKVSRIEKIPKWLNIAFGYSANGMIYEFHNPQFYRGQPFPHFERYRQYLLSLDIDFTKLPAKKKWLKSVYKAVNLIKIPFPAIELNRANGIQFHPIYF